MILCCICDGEDEISMYLCQRKKKKIFKKNKIKYDSCIAPVSTFQRDSDSSCTFHRTGCGSGVSLFSVDF